MAVLNSSDKAFVEKINSLSIEEARKEVASGSFGAIDSPNFRFASMWLAVKEAEERDRRDAKIILFAKISALAAIVAAILTLISLLR